MPKRKPKEFDKYSMQKALSIPPEIDPVSNPTQFTQEVVDRLRKIYLGTPSVHDVYTTKDFSDKQFEPPSFRITEDKPDFEEDKDDDGNIIHY